MKVSAEEYRHHYHCRLDELPHWEKLCVHMIKYMPAEQTGLINLDSTANFCDT